MWSGQFCHCGLQLYSTMESTGRIYLLHSFKQLILELQLIETVSWKTVLILRYFCRFRYLAYLSSFLYTETVLLCLLHQAFTLAWLFTGLVWQWILNFDFIIFNQPMILMYICKKHTLLNPNSHICCRSQNIITRIYFYAENQFAIISSSHTNVCSIFNTSVVGRVSFLNMYVLRILSIHSWENSYLGGQNTLRYINPNLEYSVPPQLCTVHKLMPISKHIK